MSTKRRPRQKGKFIPLQWVCYACSKRGAANVFRYAGESNAQCERRYQSQVRGQCIAGCEFIASKTETGAGSIRS